MTHVIFFVYLFKIQTSHIKDPTQSTDFMRVFDSITDEWSSPCGTTQRNNFLGENPN